MARYEHLPIYREAYDLALHFEKIVRHFSRYHKYTLGAELRKKSWNIVEKIIEANNAKDRIERLLELRQKLESFKVLCRLCHDSGGFASARGYLHVAERITGIAKQNEGWIRQTTGKGRRRRKALRKTSRKDPVEPDDPRESATVSRQDNNNRSSGR